MREVLNLRKKVAHYSLAFIRPICYNMCMVEMKKKPRKKRSDRRHVIYTLEVAGLAYVGLTVFERTEKKSVVRRFQKHVSRAKVETGKKWTLCKAIRKHGAEKFIVSVVATVKGKSEAHKAERALIMKLRPALNTDIRQKAA